ncbi:MAG: PilZ domain-containing protein [Desulforhopalus sp.]
MTDSPDTQRSFVTDNNETRIVCPACGMAKTLSVEKFKNQKHNLKIKCRCSYIFHVQLEFRRHRRKQTELDGVYVGKQQSSTAGGKVKVLNLSLSGAYFEVKGIHDLRVGQRGELIFTLDDRKKTSLTKEVIIRSVNKNRIGVAFVEDRAFQKELGFYLLP